MGYAISFLEILGGTNGTICPSPIWWYDRQYKYVFLPFPDPVVERIH